MNLVNSNYLTDQKRRDILFKGSIIIFKNVPSMQRLAKKVQELAERIYQVEPVVAHLHHEKGQFIDFTNQIQRITSSCAENRNLLINALSETGVDISSTAIESFFLYVFNPQIK